LVLAEFSRVVREEVKDISREIYKVVCFCAAVPTVREGFVEPERGDVGIIGDV